MLVLSSTQHPSEVQHLVAKVLGLPDSAVVAEVRRMGGAFGGKETQAALIACVAALLAWRTGRPVKFRLDRDDDMMLTGKRHDFIADYNVGFAADGRIRGIEFMLASRCGISPDLSGAVNDRAMMHADNCYSSRQRHHYLSSLQELHTVSNTAFRGFGGPQAHDGDPNMSSMRSPAISARIRWRSARSISTAKERNITPYRMKIRDNIIAALVARLEAMRN